MIVTLGRSGMEFLAGPTVRRAEGAPPIAETLIALGLVHRVGPYLRITAAGLRC